MAYEIDTTQLTGGDTPTEPGNPRTFPEIYNTLVVSIQDALNEVEDDTSNALSQLSDLQTQVNTIYTELTTLIDGLQGDLEEYKIATDNRLDILESEINPEE